MNLILPVSATKASLVFTGSPAHALASYALSQIAETLLESYEKGTKGDADIFLDLDDH